ncbi:hypothetical protein EVAR_38159_1 [Eumeta japonica]|uniref:Uncharacterized protein n=1 Tax=Eumeta variegata TaxID=151549 RepID=A0A4C1ZKH1_EUMVA|nr:hypothetical protein EVAR_38159_1 [Eumeta japonica]
MNGTAVYNGKRWRPYFRRCVFFNSSRYHCRRVRSPLRPAAFPSYTYYFAGEVPIQEYGDLSPYVHPSPQTSERSEETDGLTDE